MFLVRVRAPGVCWFGTLASRCQRGRLRSWPRCGRAPRGAVRWGRRRGSGRCGGRVVCAQPEWCLGGAAHAGGPFAWLGRAGSALRGGVRGRRVGGVSGLVHDVGKGACAWQDGLRAVEARGQGRVGVPHKHAGTVLAERYTQLACAAVVFGHHGGLPDLERLRDELHKGRPGGSEAARVAEAIHAVERIVPEIHRRSLIAKPGWLYCRRGKPTPRCAAGWQSR
ncbi:CRISPR-associated endonuclease Cas3'' [Streptomyces violaceus]